MPQRIDKPAVVGSPTPPTATYTAIQEILNGTSTGRDLFQLKAALDGTTEGKLS
jgi:hypothetical protein